MDQTPKIKIPMNVADGRIETVEQDSIDELAQCAYAILATEVGTRVEEPEFGIPDQSHRKGGVDTEEVREALGDWEPRITQSDDEDEWEDVQQKVRVIISG